jgi:AcrR family transcriptional regulator
MSSSSDISTEQLILETAEKLFLEKGFAMTSTTEIARVAGCNQAMVHYYFRTKENLFQSIFEKKFKLLISSFMEGETTGATFEEKLRNKISSHFDLLKSNPNLPFLIFNELTTNPQRIASLKEKLKEIPVPIFKQFEEALQTEIAEGRIRPTTAIDLLMTILSVNAMPFVASTILRKVLELNETEYEQLLEHRREVNIETVLNSLRP